MKLAKVIKKDYNQSYAYKHFFPYTKVNHSYAHIIIIFYKAVFI